MLTFVYTRFIERGAKLPATLLLAVYFIVAILQLQHYFSWQSAFFGLSIITMGVVSEVDHTRPGSMRCGWIALLFLLLSWKTQVFTLRYATLITAVFFVIEYFYGRLSRLSFITAVLIAPAIDFAVNVFSFPIRLWLTGMAGKMLAGINPAVTTTGNMILLGNHEFTVDIACMGLQMLLTSLLCGIMMIALYQRRYHKELPALATFFILGVITVLNIIANLFRILLLVQFSLPPGTLAHDAVGIITLLVYVLLPLLLGIPWMLHRYGKAPAGNAVMNLAPVYGLGLQLLLAAGIIAGHFMLTKNMTTTTATTKQVKQLPGYSYTSLDDNIIKQTTADALLYVKGIPGFYFTDHQPMICWKGSGFEFYKVQEENIQGTKVYTAELKKDSSTLYTAWWYESRSHRSTSQLEWRWNALCSGNSYFLVNITVDKKALLAPEIKHLLSAHLIQ
ncbi:exosortase N [Chitinophaga arvensicola]|uniref:Exosortase N n=1 Tax=Chitinophaga arvensicola TaxID=29529 RepID=A0A1I0RKT8_9BACT|nr:exosortase N [Chitinophaga arvensicola]SEW40924.1 exosortase N [Chitinophaga arvensicola]